VRYIEHVEEVTRKPGTSKAETQVSRQTRTGPELETDGKGYPLLPPPGKKQEALQAQKDLIRVFIVMHYRAFRSEEWPSSKTECLSNRICLRP